MSDQIITTPMITQLNMVQECLVAGYGREHILGIIIIALCSKMGYENQHYAGHIILHSARDLHTDF